MPRIHHTIQKMAEREQINLFVTDDDKIGSEWTVYTEHAAFRRTWEHMIGRVAFDTALLQKRFGNEYAKLHVHLASDVTSVWYCPDYTLEGDGEGRVFLQSYDAVFVGKNIDVIFSECLDLCVEKELDVEEPDFGPKGDVVSDKYKKEYAANGDKNNCGDWIARWMDGRFTVTIPDSEAKVFDHEKFADCLAENGVDMTKGKWIHLPSSGRPGWPGRYRMNGRQKLDPIVAKAGFIVHRGKKTKLPEEDLELLRAKHPSWEEADEAA